MIKSIVPHDAGMHGGRSREAVAGRGLWTAGASLLLLAVTSQALLGAAGRDLEAAAGRILIESPRVFIGTLVGAESRWVDDGRNIATVYRFRVTDWFKGDGVDSAEIIEYGGQIGPLRLTVSHAAAYQEGGRYLVFAQSDEDGAWRTAGGSVGSLPVIQDGQGRGHLRLFQAHPIARLLGTTAAFVEVSEISGRLSQLLGGRHVDSN